jgi:hypothetical protein
VFTGTGTGVVPVLTGDSTNNADFNSVAFSPTLLTTDVAIPSGFSAKELSITSGKVNFANNLSLIFTGGTTLSMSSDTYLKFAGTTQLPYGGYSLANTSYIDYTGAVQIIRALPFPYAYSNITLSGPGVKILAGEVNIGSTLTVAAGVTLNIGASNTLALKGTYQNTGTGCVRGSKTSNLWYKGYADSSFNFDQVTPYGNALNNVTVGLSQIEGGSLPSIGNNLDLIIGNKLDIYGVVTLISGHLKTNGNVTLKSDAYTTAMIAPIIDGTIDSSDLLLENNGITGNVTVERYIPATRAYRPLSSSVTGGTIFSNWQENGSVASLTGSILGNTLTTTDPSTPLAVGQHISGNLIPANTTITSRVNAVSNEYEISMPVQNVTSRTIIARNASNVIVANFTGEIVANVMTPSAFIVGSIAVLQNNIPNITLNNTLTNSVIIADNSNGTFTVGQKIASQVIHYNGAPAGYGTHVSGLSCTDAQLGQNDFTTGLDRTRSGNSSLYTYNNVSNTFEAVTNTKSEILTAGKPYLMLIRGDRTIDLALNAATPTNTTLRSVGTIAVGPVDVTSSLSPIPDFFNFVGNPYQAPVNLRLIYEDTAATRWAYLGASYTVFDTKVNTRGAYVTFDFTDLISTNVDSEMDEILEPNQAFFVTTQDEPPTLVFNEIDKVTTNNIYVPMFRTRQNTTPIIKGSICNASTNKTLDGFILAFSDSFSNTIIAEDTRKPSGNQDETFASTNDVAKMAIDKRNFPSEADEIPLSITQYRLTNYVMKFNVSNFDQMDAYLIDTYTATETTLNNDEINSYPFTVNASIPASIAENRFKIVFRNSALQNNSNSISAFAVYPNPVVDNKFTIKSNQVFSGKDANITILNAIGQKVYSTNGIFSTDGSLLVNPTVALSKGIYLVKVAVEGKVETKKLIIK